MKIYHLVRDEDESGVSGTGIVGEVVEFEDGASVLRWRKSNASGIASTVIYDSIIQLEAIHGHGGKTRLVSCGEFFPISSLQMFSVCDCGQAAGNCLC